MHELSLLAPLALPHNHSPRRCAVYRRHGTKPQSVAPISVKVGTPVKYKAFLSHFKAEAGAEVCLAKCNACGVLHEAQRRRWISPASTYMTAVCPPSPQARILQMAMETAFGLGSIFLDSDQLHNLTALLEDHVPKSEVLVVLQTTGILTRPWCLLEIITAIKRDVPIVTVNVQGQHPYVSAKSIRKKVLVTCRRFTLVCRHAQVRLCQGGEFHGSLRLDSGQSQSWGACSR